MVGIDSLNDLQTITFLHIEGDANEVFIYLHMLTPQIKMEFLNGTLVHTSFYKTQKYYKGRFMKPLTCNKNTSFC